MLVVNPCKIVIWNGTLWGAGSILPNDAFGEVPKDDVAIVDEPNQEPVSDGVQPEEEAEAPEEVEE